MRKLKLSKTLIVLALASLFILASYNNIIDYDTNFAYIKNVMEMTQVRSEVIIAKRAISNAYLQHICYCLIIMLEGLTGILLLVAGIKMSSSIRSTDKYNQGKGLAILGLTLGTLIYGFAFFTIGAEWFYSWQAKIWNSKNASASLLIYCLLSLIYISSNAEVRSE